MDSYWTACDKREVKGELVEERIDSNITIMKSKIEGEREPFSVCDFIM